MYILERNCFKLHYEKRVIKEKSVIHMTESSAALNEVVYLCVHLAPF